MDFQMLDIWGGTINNSLHKCIYQTTNKRCGMPKQELLVELWSIENIMRAFTLDAIGLKLLGKEWKKIFV